MSDLVKRLREPRAYKGRYDDEAADRIEILESALKRLGRSEPFPGANTGTAHEVIKSDRVARIKYAQEALK